MRTYAALALCFLTAAALHPQASRPDLSGHWEMNASQSTGRNPKACKETIEYKDPVLTISSVLEDARGQSTTFLRLTTDGRENVNDVGGHEFHSKSHWEGGKLLTEVTGDGGLSMSEVRSLSADGKTQTVESFMGPSRTTPMAVRVMEKR